MHIANKTQEIENLIEICKSNSGIAGPKLARTHIRLGELLAKELDLDPEDTTIVAILRGGIFFAQGIYFELGCKFQIYDPKNDKFLRPNTKNVVLVDSVINTGNTISKIWEPGMLVASCVTSEKETLAFSDSLYTIRTSKNSFVGSNVHIQNNEKGPDTTLRLFNQL